MDVILKKYFWVLNLVVIGICATLAGRATAGILAASVLPDEGPAAGRHHAAPPLLPPSEPPHMKDVEAILNRNVFCSACAPIKPKDLPQADGPVDQTPQRSTLPLQLLVTMVAPGEPQISVAVIRDTADERKPVRPYRRGDRLPQGATLLQVVDGRAYMMVGRGIQYLDRDGAPPPPTPATPSPAVAAAPEPSPIGAGASALDKEVEKGVRCTGNNCEVDKPLIDKFLQNTSELATSARFVPSSKDGKPNGFKVYAIRPGSVFAKLGMQNADLVKSINGLDMATPDKAFEAYTKLKTATHLTMQLERRGETVTLDYQIR